MGRVESKPKCSCQCQQKCPMSSMWNVLSRSWFQCFSTDTSSDDGSSMPADSNTDPSEAYQEYAFARKKWRRISSKFPRRYRRFGKGGKGGTPSYASFLPPQAFAGGKGGPNQKGRFRRKNPKDKSGQVMRCNIGQSDEHLWRECPKRPQQDCSFATGSASRIKPKEIIRSCLGDGAYRLASTLTSNINPVSIVLPSLWVNVTLLHLLWCKFSHQLLCSALYLRCCHRTTTDWV